MTIDLELPEVETIRHALDREIAGRKVKTVDMASMATLSRYRNRKSFASRVEGRKLGPVRRMGLTLVIKLDNDDLLVIRPGAGATIRRHAARDAVQPGTEATFTFTIGGQFRLVDPEGASELCVVAPEELLSEFPELGASGIDPAGEMVPWTAFAGQVLGRKMPLKDLLCDDAVVVGCDSMLAIAGELQGKPHTVDVARRRWETMAGRRGELLTGHAVVRVHGGSMVAAVTACSTTTVHFGEPGRADLESPEVAGSRLRSGIRSPQGVQVSRKTKPPQAARVA
mgnify:CR=1 FL=1